ncbi:nucleoside-diphosphate-sugar epimerase [Mycolicibacterium chubuense NBB4]|uniref:Nucleoside-diphosphate-sugar epimerase n=1 Tax=Mycolicibacterium chubuense (strain NBB4) TaxID=710421 RepID=I4BPX0_MYCCN|nr:NAD-dependent epimerase/dehydratase family protein [Mycolicibacterium chubuense]AFM19327.1 nucleoside-diphosphate-sugar epimerase [Mycolicibacterium chubuense NBB4]
MRALVTGAAGFIGSTLVDRLLRDGHDVVGIDNLSTGLMTNLDSAFDYYSHGGCGRNRFTFVRNDIQAPELADIVMGSNPDVIFHLAAQVNLRASVTDPLFDARSNVLGTVNLCEACREAGVRRVVYAASGGSRYGAPTHLPVSESVPLGPLSPYAVAKVAGELYLRAYAEMYGISPICLALANVYGPRQNPLGEAGVITVFASAMLTGRGTRIFGDGTSSRDYVYVDDVVDAFVRAGAAHDGVTDTFNIGTGLQTTVGEVHRLVSDAVGSCASPAFNATHPGELHAIALDSSKAEAVLGWKPTVGVADGVQKTIEWLRATLVPGSEAQAPPKALIGA